MESPEPKHRLYGTPVSEWIKLVGELEVDAVGLWQIVTAGREGFRLEGAALDEFVRRSLLAHFAYGALPVRHVPGDPNVWTVQTAYGEKPESMADAIINEWINQGRPNPSAGDLWLALRRIADQPFTNRDAERA